MMEQNTKVTTTTTDVSTDHKNDNNKDNQSNRWFLTCNNPGDFTLESVWDPEYLVYMVGQKEKAPTTGTEHIHAYIVFKSKKRFSTVKNWAKAKFPNEPDIEKCEGNEKQNKIYVTKPEDRIAGPWEFGKYDEFRGISGKRTDLIRIYNMIKAGKNFKEIAESYPGDVIRYTSNIQNMIMSIQPTPPIQRDVRVMTLWGPTGVGKTHRILTTFPDIYQVIPGRDPWGNYQGETEILFDEFQENSWTIQQLNRFLDKWRCKLDSRYHDRYAMWTKVFICANSDPQYWYMGEKNGALIESLHRRLGLVPGGNGTVVEVISKEQEIPLLVHIVDVPTGITVINPTSRAPTAVLNSLDSPDLEPVLKRAKANNDIMIINDD
jgi:hypothetical protein